MIIPDRTHSPELAPLRRASLPQAHTETLPNGIKLVTLDGCEQPVTAISVVRPGGTAEFANPSLAAILLNTVSEGSIHHTGAEIAEILDYNGAWLKSSVMPHHTVTTLFALNSKMAEVMPVFTEMLANPVFPEQELEVKKQQAARNLQIKQQDVSYLAAKYANMLYAGKNHPLSRISQPEEILTITRRELMDAIKDIAVPSGTVVFMAGNITGKVMQTVTNSLLTINSERIIPLALNIRPFAPEHSPCVKKVKREDATQTAINIAIPAIGRDHPDYPLLHVTVMALGGYFGSRLMMNLREDKGYTYGVTATLSGMHEGGVANIELECDNRYTDAAINEIHRELQRLVSAPPEGEELERLRRSALVSHLETLDSPIDIMAFYRNYITAAVPADYFEAKQNVILNLTPAEISRAASLYLVAGNPLTAIVGNPR